MGASFPARLPPLQQKIHLGRESPQPDFRTLARAVCGQRLPHPAGPLRRR